MQELLGKLGRFCESHIEKIVLIVVGGVSAYLFFTRVIFSPNTVEYDQKNVSPSRIDSYVSLKVQDLRTALAGIDRKDSAVEPVSLVNGEGNPLLAKAFPSRPAPENFMALFENPLSFLEPDGASIGPVRRMVAEKRYALPSVGRVTDVAAVHIRAAAYVPIEPVTTEMDYTLVPKEPNDLDLVTVEARFDVKELYRQFKAYFDGTEVEKREWRDPALAVPEFAGVQLERQQLRPDGSWSEWVEVPRARVEQYASLLTPIEKVKDLPPGGVPIRLMQLGSPRMTMAMLQPEGYQIASPNEDWLPPSFYGKYKELQGKIEMEERRKEREERLNQQQTAAEDNTNRRGVTNDTTTGRTGRVGGGGRRNAAGGGGGVDYGAGGNRRNGNTGRTRTRGDTANDPRAAGREQDARGGRVAEEVTTTEEAYLDFADALINDDTDLSKLDDVLFWAFDDTTEPGNTYRYRIRLGVFNPVAGTNMLVERDMDMKDQAILWSSFSDLTQTIAIPKRLYFFARDVQSRTSTATVEVARYALGHWYRENFQIHPGEVIGREMEPPEPEEDEEDTTGGRITGRNTPQGGMATILQRERAVGTSDADDSTVPDMIDYRTNVMLIDFVEATDLGTPPNLQQRPYYDLLYTADGVTIEHMPATQRLWPQDLQQAYQQISRTRTDDIREPFRNFTASSRISEREARGRR